MIAAIALGSVLLTSWDFVLDPAMSQTALPFWVWDQPGAFFGMPYQNFAGWLGTGIVFMTVATLIWKAKPVNLPDRELGLPLAIYLSNFTFATVISIAEGIYLPVFLGILTGIIPVLVLYKMANSTKEIREEVNSDIPEITPVKIPVSAGVRK